MKIGKATVPRTSICTSDEHTIVIRGRDLSKDLIGKFGFVDHFFLLLTGACRRRRIGGAERDPDRDRRHGLVPSVQAARMTFAAAPDAMQGAVAAGILGCGSVVLGASETRAHVQRDRRQGEGRHAAARRRVRGDEPWRAAGKTIPGYGHPCTRSATNA